MTSSITDVSALQRKAITGYRAKMNINSPRSGQASHMVYHLCEISHSFIVPSSVTLGGKAGKQMIKNPHRFYIVLGLLVATYLILSILIKPQQSVLDQYHITQAKALTITLTIALLFSLIWLTAVYGFVELLLYNRLIRNTKDGEGLRKLTLGLGFIAFRQPVNSILTTLNNYLSLHNPGWTSRGVIIINYFGVLVALAGFTLISLGTDELVEVTRKKSRPVVKMTFRVFSLLLVTAYTYLALGKGDYQTPLTPGGKANFYLPSWLIVSTIIVPYAYAWYAAFVATYNLRFYSTHVKGVLYKQSLHWLAVGITIIIINTILLQFISAQGSQLNKLHLVPLLGLVYVLLISIGLGFAVVAAGAKKMKRIEEV